MKARLLAAPLLLCGVLFFSPTAASAHGLVGRADLPIPAWLFGWAASAVLILSFVALAVLWRDPKLARARSRQICVLPRALEAVCGAIGVGLFMLVLYSGFAGTQTATANLAPTFIYVLFWVGLVPLSLLFGNLFRAFNPWLAIGRAGSLLAKAFGRRELPAPLPYPDRLGYWPAALGLLFFAWLELAYSGRDDPSTLAWLTVVYATLQLAGMALYGVDRWSERGDAFAVYFALFARLSPLEFDRSSRALKLRVPLAGAPRFPVLAGTVPLLCIAIGATTFDGLSAGPLWSDVAPKLQNAFVDLGFSLGNALELAFTVGLLTVVLLVAGFYKLGVRGMQSIGGKGAWARELAGKFAHSLIPIACAYVLAHYFSLLIYQGQAAAYLFSDPLGRGDNLIGLTDYQIDYGVISATGIWYVQVAALVVGHVVALMLAHDRAVSLYKDSREATRSQYWMLVVMVGFTSLGLWLLSAAN